MDRHRRQRRAGASTRPGAAVTAFRIGGPTDPGRFVVRQQQQFLVLGFHSEERSDASSRYATRNALSPVREHFPSDSDLLLSGGYKNAAEFSV